MQCVAGFMVSGQGVAHKATGEMANLPELASRTGSERAADEIAHTTFFPCLVLQSAFQSMYGGNDSSGSGNQTASSALDSRFATATAK
jgi:hypothetical protein